MQADDWHPGVLFLSLVLVFIGFGGMWANAVNGTVWGFAGYLLVVHAGLIVYQVHASVLRRRDRLVREERRRA